MGFYLFYWLLVNTNAHKIDRDSGHWIRAAAEQILCVLVHIFPMLYYGTLPLLARIKSTES